MNDRPSETSASTPVTIFGRTYHLRGDEDPTYLHELAAMVDARMREAADATGTADTLKVAILASLNLADDSLKAGNGASRGNPGAERRLTQLVVRLDEALAETDRRLP